MFLSILLIVFSLLFIFSNFKTLMAVPFASWELPQYIIAGISVVLAVVCVLNIFRAKKQWKVQKEKLAQAYAAENEKVHAKRRALYLEEDIDIEADVPEKTIETATDADESDEVMAESVESAEESTKTAETQSAE